MRLTSEFWAASLIRRVNGAGGFASIVKKGAGEAGSIFVVARHANHSLELYGPAPQTAYAGDKPQERQFSRLLDGADEAAIDAFLQAERRFDSDLWIVEIEPGKLPVSEVMTITTP